MTSWKIAIRSPDCADLDGYEDVTDYVISANWFLGMRHAYQNMADDSMLHLVLDNSGRIFSPEAAASGSLAGLLSPFTQITVSSDDGTVSRVHWSGWIETVEPSTNQYGERSVAIRAAGPMLIFQDFEADVEVQRNQKTSEIIKTLIRQVQFPVSRCDGWILGLAGYSELDGPNTRLGEESGNFSDEALSATIEDGVVTLAVAGDNWIQRGAKKGDDRTFNVYRAIADVVAAERGRFFFDRGGRPNFWNRSHLQLIPETPAAVLDNTMTDLVYTYAGLDDFKNRITVVCHPREVGSVSERLWKLVEPLTIEPGEKKVLSFQYTDEDKEVSIGADEVTETHKFSAGDADIKLIPQATGAKLRIRNNGTSPAVLSKCTVWGIKITDYGQLEADAEDKLSGALYGSRRMRLNIMSVDDLDYAQYIADYELGLRSQPRGLMNAVTLKSHGKSGGNRHDAQLTLTVGDLVEIIEEQTEHHKSYYIVGEAHRLTRAATLLETTWYLELAPTDQSLWILGHTTQSALGETTRLGF